MGVLVVSQVGWGLFAPVQGELSLYRAKQVDDFQTLILLIGFEYDLYRSLYGCFIIGLMWR